MHRLFTLSMIGVLAAASAISACADSSKPPETPEVATAEAETPPPTSDATPAPEQTAAPMGTVVNAPKIDKSMMLDNYEMTPSDCDALGRKYGELARAEMTATLSPKLSEKQRAATLASIEKAVAPREEGWTKGCMTSLVNKAADHEAIKCALASKSVKDFDVCINGQGGTPQPQTPAGKPKKK